MDDAKTLVTVLDDLPEGKYNLEILKEKGGRFLKVETAQGEGLVRVRLKNERNVRDGRGEER